MTNVVWIEPALRPLEAIRTYIARFNPRAARDVAAGLKALGDGLSHFPRRGRPVRGTNMRELISTYPHIIRYFIEGDTGVVLHVRHTSRRSTNPGRLRSFTTSLPGELHDAGAKSGHRPGVPPS